MLMPQKETLTQYIYVKLKSLAIDANGECNFHLYTFSNRSLNYLGLGKHVPDSTTVMPSNVLGLTVNIQRPFICV